MISHVLDTDVLSLFQKGHPTVCQHCAAAPQQALAITVISVEEQFLGWYTRIRQAKTDGELARASDGMTAFANFVKRLPILSFSLPAIQVYHRIKGIKAKVSKKDLRIAAIALAAGATLVTRNRRDFTHVPGLKIEDWSR